MEPTQSSIRYVIETFVVKVENIVQTISAKKSVDGDIILDRRNMGWFVHFYGSRESLFFGNDRPEFNEGDAVKITFERISTCPPSQTTNPTNSPSS